MQPELDRRYSDPSGVQSLSSPTYTVYEDAPASWPENAGLDAHDYMFRYEWQAADLHCSPYCCLRMQSPCLLHA